MIAIKTLMPEIGEKVFAYGMLLTIVKHSGRSFYGQHQLRGSVFRLSLKDLQK